MSLRAGDTGRFSTNDGSRSQARHTGLSSARHYPTAIAYSGLQSDIPRRGVSSTAADDTAVTGGRGLSSGDGHEQEVVSQYWYNSVDLVRDPRLVNTSHERGRAGVGEGDRGADIGLPGRAGDTRALAGQRMERGGRSYPGGDRGERQAQTAGTSSGAVVGLTRGDSSGTVNVSGGSNETGYRTQPE